MKCNNQKETYSRLEKRYYDVVPTSKQINGTVVDGYSVTAQDTGNTEWYSTEDLKYYFTKEFTYNN